MRKLYTGIYRNIDIGINKKRLNISIMSKTIISITDTNTTNTELSTRTCISF